MLCKNCGGMCRDEAKFCQHCGANLENFAAPEPENFDFAAEKNSFAGDVNEIQEETQENKNESIVDEHLSKDDDKSGNSEEFDKNSHEKNNTDGPEMEHLFCSSCGGKNNINSAFCGFCGAPLMNPNQASNKRRITNVRNDINDNELLQKALFMLKCIFKTPVSGIRKCIDAEYFGPAWIVIGIKDLVISLFLTIALSNFSLSIFGRYSDALSEVTGINFISGFFKLLILSLLLDLTLIYGMFLAKKMFGGKGNVKAWTGGYAVSSVWGFYGVLLFIFFSMISPALGVIASIVMSFFLIMQAIAEFKAFEIAFCIKEDKLPYAFAVAVLLVSVVIVIVMAIFTGLMVADVFNNTVNNITY